MIIISTQSKVNPGPMVSKETLAPMMEHALQLVSRANSNPNFNHKKQWFGHLADTNNEEITEWTQRMYKYLNEGLTKLSFSCCSTVDSIASFAQYKADKVRGGRFPPTKTRNMQLNAGFSSDRYSYGEKVGSILHEITHMRLGTNDEKIGSRDCYGADLCGVLARAFPDLAMTNADNWAYYFTSYHVDLGLTGANWKYLTEAEVEERSAGLKCTIDKGISVQMSSDGKY